MITDAELIEMRTLWRQYEQGKLDDAGDFAFDFVPRLLDEIERLRAVLLEYAEEYEGCESARDALGLPPMRTASSA